jgi:hypothetical protein
MEGGPKQCLQEQVVALTAELNAIQTSKRGKKANSMLPYEDQPKNLGKQYAITGDPWLNCSAFGNPRPEDDFELELVE